nr:MAG TPA: hypothetical protein [Caudoviricetes sp.]
MSHFCKYYIQHFDCLYNTDHPIISSDLHNYLLFLLYCY